MKLVLIITQKENEKNLEEAFVSRKYSLTKWESRGGFLKKKNYTFCLGVEDEKVENVLEIVKETCRTKEEMVGPMPAISGLSGETLAESSTKIKVGGATCFILDIEKVLRV